MTTRLTHGWLEGHPVRVSRQPHRCEYWRGASAGGLCRNVIAVGERYVEGEPNDTAGGWGNARYCLCCMADDYPELIAREVVA
jgi:hypothetical protein